MKAGTLIPFISLTVEPLLVSRRLSHSHSKGHIRRSKVFKYKKVIKSKFLSPFCYRTFHGASSTTLSGVFGYRIGNNCLLLVYTVEPALYVMYAPSWFNGWFGKISAVLVLVVAPGTLYNLCLSSTYLEPAGFSPTQLWFVLIVLHALSALSKYKCKPGARVWPLLWRNPI